MQVPHAHLTCILVIAFTLDVLATGQENPERAPMGAMEVDEGQEKEEMNRVAGLLTHILQ